MANPSPLLSPSASTNVLDMGEQAEILTQGVQTSQGALEGSVLVLILYDVCEEIQLEELRRIIGARTVAPTFKSAAPEYVRFARPPVVEPIDPITLDGTQHLEGQIKYYDYGVLSVVFELPFSGDWDTLVRLGSRWVWDVDFEKHATRIVRARRWARNSWEKPASS